jgi:ABC-type polysaccharide/polyol phosphate transport system ATPase subunit
MNDVAIRVSGLSKRYRIGAAPERYRTLRDTLAAGALGPFRAARAALGHGGAGRDAGRTVWALNGVSFEVGRGEVVGVIGRNGSGKSTLLKVLSRITEPTAGSVDVYGRVGSLLEVGTGFHPELTGRENIYLNGSILGMPRAEIDRRLDEIVAFAEVERFLDTPVKHYSSGMYLRLAFAVAAHLLTPILLVDEVLAVGDAGFQDRCLGKMSEAAGQGRTLLFVSHNMQAIAALTRRCLVLSDGRVHFDGRTDRAIAAYYDLIGHGKGSALYTNRKGPLDTYIRRAAVETSTGLGAHGWGKPLAFEFELQVGRPSSSLTFSFQVVDRMGRPVCHFWLFDRDAPFRGCSGTFRLRCEVPKYRLYMGAYTLTTWLAERRGNAMAENLTGICPFSVSMDGARRDEYDWVEGTCAYLEDAVWKPVEVLSEGVDTTALVEAAPGPRPGPRGDGLDGS